MLARILGFASVAEVVTGLALLVDPRLVVALLLGGESTPPAEIAMARLPGIAILALGLACWPGGQHSPSASPALLGMFVYSVLIALFLAYLFLVGHMGGVLLWPAVALHVVVALLLIWTWSVERRVTPQL